MYNSISEFRTLLQKIWRIKNERQNLKTTITIIPTKYLLTFAKHLLKMREKIYFSNIGSKKPLNLVESASFQKSQNSKGTTGFILYGALCLRACTNDNKENIPNLKKMCSNKRKYLYLLLSSAPNSAIQEI